jgi:hypothetical protein
MDTGKPLNLSRNLDIARSIDNFRFFAKTLLELPPVSFKQVGLSVGRSVCGSIDHFNHRLISSPCLVTDRLFLNLQLIISYIALSE